MSLISCPECNHQVSSLATSCPNCGAPVIKVDSKNVVKHEDGLRCSKCSWLNVETNEVCARCGYSLGEVQKGNNLDRTSLSNNKVQEYSKDQRGMTPSEYKDSSGYPTFLVIIVLIILVGLLIGMIGVFISYQRSGKTNVNSDITQQEPSTSTTSGETGPFKKMTTEEHLVRALNIVSNDIDTSQLMGLDEARKHLNAINIKDKEFAGANNLKNLTIAKDALSNAIDTSQLRWLDVARRHIYEINVKGNKIAEEKKRIEAIIQSEKAEIKQNKAAIEQRKVAKKQEKADPSLEIAARKEFASMTEQEYLKDGMDYYFRAQGKNNTTLYIKYVLMSRPLAYNIINDSLFIQTLRSLGFKKLILTDGYDSTWTSNL